jgi:Regulator of chromosome condensation (RCC1) repeat
MNSTANRVSSFVPLPVRQLLLPLLAMAGCAPPVPPASSLPTPAPVLAQTQPPAAPSPCEALASWPPPAPCVERIAAGGTETCLVTVDRAFCWSDGVRVIARDALEDEGLRMGGRRMETVRHACGIDPSRGVVTCSGDHIGVRLQIDPDVPMALPAGASPIKVAVGPEHFCALTAEGAVHCQGDNDQGQLGDGSITTTFDDKPVRVKGLPPAIDVVVGDRHSCALTQDGAVYCWGETPSPPGFVPPLARERYVDAHHSGESSTGAQLCALTDGGKVACRGFVSHVFRPMLEGAAQIAAMAGETYARDDQARVWRWSSGGTPERAELLEPASKLAPAAACVRLAGTDAIRCMKPLIYGEKAQAYSPGKGMALAVGPSVSYATTSCGLDRGGAVRCWGNVGQDWRYLTVQPPLVRLWTPHWTADDVMSLRAKPVQGSRNIVELGERGQCARDRSGRLWLLTRRRRQNSFRLELRTNTGAEGAVRLIDSNRCIAARADGSLFELEPAPGFALQGPPTIPPPVVSELSEAVGAVQIEFGYDIECIRFADGRTRCRQPPDGAFDIPLSDRPSHRIIVNNREACALLTEGGMHCREVRDDKLSPTRAPMHHGSTVALAVWP